MRMARYRRLCIDSGRSKTMTPFSLSNIRRMVPAESPVSRATYAAEYTSLFSIWVVHSICTRRNNAAGSWAGGFILAAYFR